MENIARALRQEVRIYPDGAGSRGDCARIAKLCGVDAALDAFRCAVREAPRTLAHAHTHGVRDGVSE